MRDNIRLAFNYFDKDKSGYLDKQEVASFLKAVEKSLADPRFVVDKAMTDRFFAKLDKDGNGQISFEELYEPIKAILLKTR